MAWQMKFKEWHAWFWITRWLPFLGRYCVLWMILRGYCESNGANVRSTHLLCLSIRGSSPSCSRVVDIFRYYPTHLFRNPVSKKLLTLWVSKTLESQDLCRLARLITQSSINQNVIILTSKSCLQNLRFLKLKRTYMTRYLIQWNKISFMELLSKFKI